MNIQVPTDVSFIIDRFYENGYEAFMVGGCIRDSLLNKTAMDYDIATSALPEITQTLFNKTIPTGIKHGTITILINNMSYEVTTYRTEGKYLDNRKPDTVTFVSSIKEDLSRRDFTINAFAYNTKEGLVDYYNGLYDLEHKIIRTVGIADNRFNEDALRMLRAIRFSSQLNFTIEFDTYNAICNNSHLIKNISKERITSELCKILLSNHASLGLINLKNTELITYILPELSKSKYLGQAISIIDTLPKDISIRLASIFNKLDLSILPICLRRLTLDNSTSNKVTLLLSHYNDISLCKSKSDTKRLINKIGKDSIFDLLSLYEVYEGICLSQLRTYVNSILFNNDPIFIKDLDINGNILKENLDLKSGKIIGEILNHLLNLVIDEKIPNNISSLIKSAEEYTINLYK